MKAKTTSGRIGLESDTIVCSTPENTQWRLPIGDVRVIGEFTNSAGPFVNDYFFLFITSDASSWYCASFYAEGRGKFLDALGLEIGAKLECGLCDSTSFKSRVMWPAHLEGSPLFEFEPEIPPVDFLSRIRHKIFSSKKVRLVKSVQTEAGLNLN